MKHNILKGDNIGGKNIISTSYKEILTVILILTGLYITSLFSYLLFHSLVEIFCIAVAVCIFMIAWNSRDKIENNYLLIIGISFIFIATLDLLHTLAYKGMGVFIGFDANLPTQLWIAARYLQGISLLIAPLFLYPKLKNKLNINFVLLIYTIVSSLLIVSIFHWKVFPDCFIEGEGLTTFKFVSEYVISLIMAASIYILYKNRKEFDEKVFSLIVASIIILIFSEMSFTAYASVFGFANMLGHLFKFVAFYLIYKAIIVTGFMKPYDLIFRNLKKSEEELTKHRDGLAELVDERTADLQAEIADHKQAEEALQKSEQEFRSLAESMPQIVWATRPDGWNIYFNQIWLDYTGMTLEESYGHGWNKPFHPDDQQRAWDAWQDATQNNGIYSIEARLRRFDGEYRWWLVRGVPLIDENDKILKWFGTCTDIEDIKRAEENVIKHSERLKNLHRIDQAILQAIDSPETVVQTAIHHIRGVLQCQRASVGIFDLENKEVKVYAADVDGKTIVEIGKVLTEEVYGVIDVLRESKIEIVENMSIEIAPSIINSILQAEGVQSSINVALVSALEMYGVLNVGWEKPRIITPEETEIVIEVANQITIAIEKARMLKETKGYATELEQRVKARTAELELEKKRAESADRLKSAFLATMSHELRTPLNSIIGFSGILLRESPGPLNPEQKKQLSMVRKSSQHLLSLINDVLDLSKIEAEQLNLHIESFDLCDSLNNVIVASKPFADKKKIQLDVSISADINTISSDKRRVEQILLNLVNNAIKFTSQGSVKIECEHIEENIIVKIKDTGIGIEKEKLNQLFKPFSQIDTGLTRAYEGTGLGLSICNKLLDMLAGDISVESEIGKGSTFTVTLPVEKSS
ncbi:MAG: ATP-binding protein [Candidatus Cloacimonetes bacterium]|nr:ATP-binding protein [Candidatus Cloacimonadota bacterium]